MSLSEVEGVANGKPARFILSNDNLEVSFSDAPTLIIPQDCIITILKHRYGVTRSQDEEPASRAAILVLCYLDAGGEGTVDEPRAYLQKLTASNLPTSLVTRFLLHETPSHLLLPAIGPHANIHVVISTLAGTGRARSVFEHAVRPLFAALNTAEYEIHKTASEATIKELTTSLFLPRANQGIQQTVILLSGDGGPVDMVNVFLSDTVHNRAALPYIGLIPTGTGNALASSSNLNKDNTFGLGALLRGTPRVLPTFRATFSPGSVLVVDEGRTKKPITPPTGSGRLDLYGAVVCSWGLHASLVADSDTVEYREFGAERFKMAAGELLKPSDGSEPHRYGGKVSLIRQDPKGKDIHELVDRQEHMYVLVTMVSNLEKTFRISPLSRPLDGQLRLVHFGPLSGEEVMRILGLAYQGGKHVEEDCIGYEAVNGVTIAFEEDTEHWRRVCIDGKIVLVEKGGWVEVHREEREVLKLIAPDLS